MKELVIAPSILSLDYSRTSEQLKELNESNAKWMHFDVMDGHFVPNLTFGPDLLKGFKKAVDMVMDVHIMVDNPDMVSEIFAKAGADIITFHLEAVKDMDACLELCRKIRAMGVQAGVSVKPKTGVEGLLAHLKEIDLILIMSVEPGFGGQSYISYCTEKIRKLKEMIERQGLKTDIQVDGGINLDNVEMVMDAGANIIVAGSAVFKGDVEQNVQEFLNRMK